MNRISRYLPVIILVFVVIFHASMLLPEVTGGSPDLNDDTFHYSLCVSMQNEIEHHGNPLDHWVPYWSMGFPVFHHYQHFPHLVVVLLYNVLLRKLSLFFVYHFVRYMLFVIYPLILYFCLRKMGFSRLSSSCVSLFSFAPVNVNGYGFELQAFTWRGSGMFSQLWAMCLLPLTFSYIYVAIKENRGYFMSAILLFMLTNSQVMFGLFAGITILLFLFMDLRLDKIIERAKRLAVILGWFCLISAYFLIPVAVDGAYQAHSSYDFPEKWDSYGANYVITQFVSGNLLDNARLPVLTVLSVFGLLFSLSRRSFKYRWAGASFILWFLLYFGRPTWGFLIDILPLSNELHLHRIIALVHFFGIILAGLALAAIFTAIKKRSNIIFAVIFLLLMAAPVYWYEFDNLRMNNQWIFENANGYKAEKQYFEPVLNYIKELPPGRVHPGRRANWGSTFKINQTAVFYFLSPAQIPALSYLPFSWALDGDFEENFHEDRLSHYNLFNIKYLLSDDKKTFPSFAKEIKRSGRFRLYAVQTTGYFDLVESPIAVYCDKNSIWAFMLLWMRSDLPDKKQMMTVFFDRKPHPGYEDYLLMKDKWDYYQLSASEMKNDRISEPQRDPINVFNVADPLKAAKYKPVSPGYIISEVAGKNEFSCIARAGRDCFLIFKMTAHRGWHAYVDGKEAQNMILAPMMNGVRLTKGVHDVKFVYRAQWWKNYLLVLAILSMIVLFFWDRKKHG
jgi:hypothetical protein